MHNNGHHHGHDHSNMISDFKKRFFISTALTIPIILLSPMIQEWLGLRQTLTFPGDSYILFILSSIVYFYGGWPFLKGMFIELRNVKPGMMTLIAIAISVAYFYSSIVALGLTGSTFFWELATLIDIMLLGHWIEMRSIVGAGKALEALVKLLPAEAHKVLPDNSIQDVPLNTLRVNDQVLVKPGEKIPTDGKIIKGTSSLNEAMLTGESNPVVKESGDNVIGGSINGDGSLYIKVSKVGEDSFLAQVIKLVKEAQESKSRTQDIANKAAQILTFIALTAGLLTLIIWLIILPQDFAFALERTVTVMVITCPHALGLAIPLVVAVSTSIAATHGLLIRSRIAFENARKINAVVFDKTGTLTEGKFGVTNVLVLDNHMTKEELLDYASAIESHSEHPIAKAIASQSEKSLQVQNFKAIPGKGAEGIVNGKKIKIVSPGYLQELNMKVTNNPIEKILAQGKTVVMVVIDNEIKGAIALADIIRPESKEAVIKLKSKGIKCIMLTGDNKQVAQQVAKKIGLDSFFAEVLPEDKVSKIKQIQQQGYVVAMTGDGINDAPALAQSDIGIAVGAGTDVAIESADIILVKSNPLDVVAIISLSQLTTRKMIQNLLWATGYNIVAIPLAAGILFKYGILLSPALGAVLMSVSTIVVAINARFLRLK